MNKNREITEVKVKYSDGEEKLIKQGMVVEFKTIEKDKEFVETVYHLLNISGAELRIAVMSMLDLGIKLGMFNKKGEKKDESNKSSEID